MKTLTLSQENPFIKVKNENIKINYKGQNYHFEIEEIMSVYLKKSKMNYIPAFMSPIFSTLGKRYKLYIRKNDSTETQIRISPSEKKYFIGLISHIKGLKKTRLLD